LWVGLEELMELDDLEHQAQVLQAENARLLEALCMQVEEGEETDSDDEATQTEDQSKSFTLPTYSPVVGFASVYPTQLHTDTSVMDYVGSTEQQPPIDLIEIKHCLLLNMQYRVRIPISERQASALRNRSD